MAQFIVRRLDDDVKRRLQRLAKRHGRSMEEEVRHILRNAANGERREVTHLGTRIAARFHRIGFHDEVAEWRGTHGRPADFDE